ncbi:MAG: adenylate kinase family protein [Candidatus Bathyarchaeia archaeon]
MKVRIGIRRVIIITGTPGVGKSSVSEMLAFRINAHILSISDLVKREKLYSGIDKKRDTLIADTNKILKRVKEIILNTAGNIIVEGHFAVDVIPREDIDIVFVLRRDPRELKKVLAERSYKEKKIIENIAAEILDVCLYDAINRCGVEKVCEIDVTSRSLDDVVQEILDVLNGVRERRVGIVDWLGKLESEGELDEYLKVF